MSENFTFSDMQGEVIGSRFNVEQRPSVMRWINHRYAMALGTDAWPWRINKVSGTGYVSAGILEGVWPDDLLVANYICNTQDGSQIEYLNPRNFLRIYSSTNIGTGEFPVHYTAINSDPIQGGHTIDPATSSAPLFGPISGGPDITILYYRKYGHYDNTGTFTFGPMVNDDDWVMWPDEWIYPIICGAIATGLKVENDDSWQSLEQEYVNALDQMRSVFLPADQGVTGQYGSQGVIGAGWGES